MMRRRDIPRTVDAQFAHPAKLEARFATQILVETSALRQRLGRGRGSAPGIKGNARQIYNVGCLHALLAAAAQGMAGTMANASARSSYERRRAV